jgi:hypothetical protein
MAYSSGEPMANSASTSNQPGAPEANTGFGCFLQGVTSLGGFFFLVILIVLIMREESWTFTIKDVLFWLVVVGMIVAKHVEVTRFETAPEGNGIGETPSLAFRRYAVILVGVAGGVWLAAQALSA